MRIPNDMFDEDHNVRPELSKNDTESDEDEFDEDGASLLDRYPWLKKTGIVVGVLTVVGVLALGTRAVLGHHNSDEPNTAQTAERTAERHRSKSTRHADISTISSSHADNSAKKSSAIKQVSESANQSAKSTSDSSATNTSAGSNSTDTVSASGHDTDAQAVQRRIQSSLPNVKVGITTLSTKGDVDVSSVSDNGQVVTTLSSDGHKFATIVTKDGSDTLSLLPGYQSYTDEHVSIK